MKPLIVVLMLALTMTACAAPLGGNWYADHYLKTQIGLLPEIRQAIERGQLIEGMTMQDVMAVWGPAASCQRVYGDRQGREVCFYRAPYLVSTGYGTRTAYDWNSVYFVKGLVVDWQYH